MTNSNEAGSQQVRSQRWLYLALVILLLPLAVTVYLSLNDSDFDAIAPLDPACDLQRGPCESVFPDGNKVSLSIEPRPISASKTLQIRVRTEGVEARSVQVDFRGVNMNMGYHRPQLKQVAPGEYAGTWVIAICGLERMVWEVTVLIQTANRKLAAPFPLVASGK